MCMFKVYYTAASACLVPARLFADTGSTHAAHAGKLIVSVPILAETRALQATAPLTIGSYHDGSLPFFGSIAHLAIFEHALDPSQVLDVYKVWRCVLHVLYCVWRYVYEIVEHVLGF
jgi:hypothetical protein